MRITCPKCHHLREGKCHRCPSPEHLKATQNLINSAALAIDMFGEDELESYAREAQTGSK